MCVHICTRVHMNMELLRTQTPDKQLCNHNNKILQNAMQILSSVYQFEMMQTLLNTCVFLTGALFVSKGKQISINTLN